MRKTTNKLLSALIAATLVLGMVTTASAASEGDTEPTAETVQETVETPAEDQQEPAAEETVTEEPAAGESEGQKEEAPAAAEEEKAEEQKVEAPAEEAPAEEMAPAEEEAVEAASVAAEETAVAMPAQTFKQDVVETVETTSKRGKKTKNSKVTKKIVTVEVSAPEGAFPEGTKMSVAKVKEDDKIGGRRKEKTYRQAIEDAEDAEVTSILAVDISFSCDGEEIKPARDISVSLKSDALAAEEGKALSIVQVTDDGSAQIVADAEIDEEKQEASFEDDTFFVYAIVGSVIIESEEGSFDFETEEYKITVSYTKEANIPVGTELIVSEVPFGSKDYEDLWKRSLTKINENATWIEGSEVAPDTRRGIASAAFFDITLMNGDEKIEPEVPLQVEISLKQGGLPLFKGQDVEIVHFGESKTRGADGTELIENVQVSKAGGLADSMPAGVAVNSFAFEQTGFSVDGIITTDDYIDFEKAEHLSSPNVITADMLRAVSVKAAGDPTINAGKTVTDNNNDGIYELALSINATSKQSSQTDVTKSNVVMVIDVSGSMGNNDSWIYYDTYTYNASTYDTYLYYSSSSSTATRLYYGQYRTGGYNSTVHTGWYYGGLQSNGNVYYATDYTGTVYAYETRLHATQRAACAVVDALLAYNTNDDNITDIFEITVVKFAGTSQTETVIRDSTSASAIKAQINGLSSYGGTNWEAALNLARTEANTFKNEGGNENTSVIFLTDGFPTYYVNNSGGQSGNGQESSDNIATSYTQARPSARNIISDGFKLYNIFAFGSDTTTYNNHTGYAYIRALANYAYGSGTSDNFNETDITRQYCFNAKSTDDLVDAFRTIINHITNNVGYAGVNLSDGVTLGATSTSVAVNGTAKEESMRYTVKDDSNKISYTVKFDSDNVATFTIYNSGGTTSTLTDNAPDTVTTTIGNETITSYVYSVTVGTGDDAKTYKISPATVDANTGMVKWDLAGLGILESGYPYTVAFDVWPKQLVYDIAADLNNKIYTKIDDALDAYNVTDEDDRERIREAIVQNADGSYSIYTNYSQEVEFYPATSQTNDQGQTTWTYGDKQTQNLAQPDPIPLQGSLLPLWKQWESGLSETELNELLWKDGVVGGTSNEYKITLYLWKADSEQELETKINTGITEQNKPYITEVLGWDNTENTYIWEKNAAVAPGMMVNIDEAEELGYDITDTTKIKEFTNNQGTTLEYYVIEPGHYYYVTEDGLDLHYELDTVIYHPMIVDGTLYNVFFGNGLTVEKMDPMYEVTAINRLKGGLNISKVVSTTQISVENGEIKGVTEPLDDDGIETCTDEFTYEIEIWKEDEQGNKSAVYTFDDQIDTENNNTKRGSIGYRIFSKPKKEGPTVSFDGQIGGAILTEDSPYANLANGIYATIENNVTTITLTMPANGEIRLVNLPSGTKYTVREITDPDANYTYAATKSQIKYNDENITEGTVTTGNTVSGSVLGNTASMETYYNWASAFYVYHSSDNTIEKISFADNRVSGTYDAENGKYDYEFNIVDETKVDETKGAYLYGGYYTAYKGAMMTDDAIKAAEYTADNDGKYWYTDREGTAYDASKANIWVKSEAYTDELRKVNGKDTGGTGTAMKPVPDVVYYLKEVPNGYIRPYIHYTYDEIAEGNPLKKLYVITASDDTNYNFVGYVLTPATTGTAATTRTLILTIKKKDGTVDAKLTAKSIWDNKTYHGTSVTLQRGYLYYTEFTSYIGTGFTFQPCWNTLDKVLVKGLTVRTVNNGTSGDLTSNNAIGVTDVAAE